MMKFSFYMETSKNTLINTLSKKIEDTVCSNLIKRNRMIVDKLSKTLIPSNWSKL